MTNDENKQQVDDDTTAKPIAPAESSGDKLNSIGLVSEELVREELKKVIDPELFVNIVDLGLVYVVDVIPSTGEPNQSEVRIEMTLTSPMCPAGPQLVANSRQVVEAMSGVCSVDVKVVMDPPWTPDLMSEDARDHLNIF